MSNIIYIKDYQSNIEQMTEFEQIQLAATSLLKDYNNTYNYTHASKDLKKGYMQLLSN